jgi:hypothetical protein
MKALITLADSFARHLADELIAPDRWALLPVLMAMSLFQTLVREKTTS